MRKEEIHEVLCWLRGLAGKKSRVYKRFLVEEIPCKVTAQNICKRRQHKKDFKQCLKIKRPGKYSDLNDRKRVAILRYFYRVSFSFVHIM